MVCMLVLLGMMISHTSKPSSWQWLIDDVNEANAGQFNPDASVAQVPDGKAAPPAAPVEPELTLIPNPTDEDPEEWALVADQFKNIRDRHPFSVEEMPPYWRLFRWSRAQTREDMAKRSKRDPFFTQLWEQPTKNRGKLFSMKLHVRRVLSHEADENSAGVKKVYELWGVTDESRSHLYCVLTDSLPPGFPEGAKVEADAYFTGYFLKILGYEASDAQRGAPVLIGKIKGSPLRQMPKQDPVAARKEFWQMVWIGLGVLCVLPLLRFLPSSWLQRKDTATKTVILKDADDQVEAWLAAPPPSDPTSPPHPNEQKKEPFSE